MTHRLPPAGSSLGPPKRMPLSPTPGVSPEMPDQPSATYFTTSVPMHYPGFAMPMGQPPLGFLPDPRPDRPWFARWWAWLPASMILILIVSALSSGHSAAEVTRPATTNASARVDAKPATTGTAPRLTLDDGWQVDRSDEFAVFVDGYVSNNSNSPIKHFAVVSFDVLNGSGDNVGNCDDVTQRIGAHGKWKFKAMCSVQSADADRVRLKEVSGQ